MKINHLLCSALALCAVAVPIEAPVQAQRSERVLEVFGNDPCPTSAGEEIVVCRRRPEAERYRIPEDLRKAEARDKESSSERTATLDSTGKSGALSCSASGAAGASGCFRKRAKEACEEDKASGKKCGIGF